MATLAEAPFSIDQSVRGILPTLPINNECCFGPGPFNWHRVASGIYPNPDHCAGLLGIKATYIDHFDRLTWQIIQVRPVPTARLDISYVDVYHHSPYTKLSHRWGLRVARNHLEDPKSQSLWKRLLQERAQQRELSRVAAERQEQTGRKIAVDYPLSPEEQQRLADKLKKIPTTIPVGLNPDTFFIDI